MIIGLSGYAQSGKDTVANILVSEFGFKRIAFADKIKELLYEMNPLIVGNGSQANLNTYVDIHGWDQAKQHRDVRKYLQDLGVGARKVFSDDFWIREALKELGQAQDSLVGHELKYVITDVRFTNEAEFIKNNYNGHICRVHRPGINAVNTHVSEHDLNEWNFDEMIYNAGSLEDLADIVRASMEFQVE